MSAPQTKPEPVSERESNAEPRTGPLYPVMPAIAERWSPRSFIDRQPEDDKLQSMFEAARLAPSAHNTQPTRFLIGRKGRGDAFGKLFECLDPHNKEWADRAPVLVLGAVMRQRFSQARGEFVAYPHAMHDLGLAVMSLIIQGQALGLHCHPMAAFDPDKAQETFAIPPLFLPGLMIAIGTLGPAEALPSELRHHETGPGARRPIEELVFEGEWGLSSPLFAGAEPRG